MDKLKNFIDTNREAFEDDLLPEGHFERFEQKLAAPRKSRATLYSLCAFAAAACIALLFLFKLPGWNTFAYAARTGGHRSAHLRGEGGDRGTSSLLQYADERHHLPDAGDVQTATDSWDGGTLERDKTGPDRQLYVRGNGPSDSALLQCRPLCHEPALQHQPGKSQHHVEADGEYEDNK